MDLHTSLLDHWRWKYSDSPYGGIVFVADHDGAIVGCSHISLSRCKVVNNEFYLGNGMDVSVYPEYRGLGIFNRMNVQRFEALRESGISLCFWSSGNPILFKKWNQISTEFPHEIHGHVRIRDTDLQLEKMKVDNPFIVKTAYTLFSSINKLRRNLNPRKSNYKLTVYPIKCFEDDMDTLWEKASQKFDFAVVRKKHYLNWRYCDRRAGKYSVLAARDEDDLVGYIVLAINNTLDGYPIGYVVDLFNVPDRSDAADALLSATLESFDEQSINLINMLSTNSSPYNRSLYLAGFLDSRVKYNLWYSYFSESGNLSDKDLKVSLFQFGDRDVLPTQTKR